MKFIINAVIVILLAGCNLTSGKQLKDNSSSFGTKMNLEKKEEHSILFKCEFDSIRINNSNLRYDAISRFIGNNDYKECAQGKAFYGDSSMIEQLQIIYDLQYNYDGRIVFTKFRSRKYEHRGLKLFNYFLSICDNFECDTPKESSFVPCKATKYISECISMIKTINGKEWDSFWSEIVSKMPKERILKALDNANSIGCDCSGAKLQYKAILKAVENNQIQLKEFGEK